MKKKVVFEGVQCDICGGMIMSDFWHKNESVLKISMTGNPEYQLKDRKHLCPQCAHSLHLMIRDWYDAGQRRRIDNEERYRAILANEKKVKE